MNQGPTGGKRTDRYKKKQKNSDNKKQKLSESRGAKQAKKSAGKSKKPDTGAILTSSVGPAKWYRQPIFFVSLVVVLVAAAGGSALALKYVKESPDDEQLASELINSDVAATPAVEKPVADPSTTPLASDADQMVASMSLEQKIGQMMMVGFDGGGPGPVITDAIQKRHAGAIILYARNISSREQVAGMNAELQALNAQSGNPFKLMIAVDQEGGKTRRFEDIGPYYSQPMIGEMHDVAPDAAQQASTQSARELKKIGINTNLAPVVDISSGWGSVMDGRAFSDNAEFVAELSARSVKGFNGATMVSAPKHFPGHGFADGNSENEPATVDADAATLQSRELLPFAAVIKENAPMIMVGHLTVPALDPSGAPATISKPITTGLLRGTMGFQGVIITDDLEMKAITGKYSIGDAAVASVVAGADIVMVAQTAAGQEEAYNALLGAVKSGKLKEEDINKSVTRIVNMKKKYRMDK